MIDYAVDPFPADDELAALWLAAWGTTGPATFANILARSLAHVGAYSEDQLVGFVNLAWDGGVHAFVLDTCVHPGWRRQRIGTGLLLKAIEVSRRRNIDWLHVDFEEQLTRFYQGCGFRDTHAGVLRL
jgi:GNAT superfamily N-acetyltransferase